MTKVNIRTMLHETFINGCERADLPQQGKCNDCGEWCDASILNVQSDSNGEYFVCNVCLEWHLFWSEKEEIDNVHDTV